MKNKLLPLFSQYFGLVIGIVFSFGIGTAYAVLKPDDIVVRMIIFISLSGWLIYIIRSVWEVLEKRKTKTEVEDVAVKITQPTKIEGKEEEK